MSGFVVETHNLTRDYGGFRALSQVNLCIEKQGITALLGPNGAGKTTLIHLLMGMLKPTHGIVKVLGTDSRILDGVIILIRKINL